MSVGGGKFILMKREKCLLEFHSTKELSSPSYVQLLLAHASPHMHSDRVLATRLWLRPFSDLSLTAASESFSLRKCRKGKPVTVTKVTHLYIVK